MSLLRIPAILGFMISAPAFGYGAIAVDQADNSRNPAYGFSVRQPDRPTAERVALEWCQNYSPEGDCQTIVWFETCGAYVNNDAYYGYGYGPTKAEAVSQAMKHCNPEGGTCNVVFAVCESDKV